MKVKNYYTEITAGCISDLYRNDEYHSYYINDSHQNEKDCLTVVKNYGHAVQFVKRKTPEICMAAVQADSYSLRCIEDQTPELCMTAVKQCGNTLQFVRNQTPEICMAAVQNNGNAIRYIRDKDLKRKIKKLDQDGSL